MIDSDIYIVVLFQTMHTCPAAVEMSRKIYFPPPLKNFQNIFPPHLDPCPQPFFPPPILIFGHIFPPLKNFLPENLVENKISLMENAIYPPKMCQKNFPPPKIFLKSSPCGKLSPPFGHLLGHV